MLIVDLTSDEVQARVIANDHEKLRDALSGYFCVHPDDISRIGNALSVEGGVILDHFILMIVNGALRKAVADAFAQRYLPCNVLPECTRDLGHDGDCDTEPPF